MLWDTYCWKWIRKSILITNAQNMHQQSYIAQSYIRHRNKCLCKKFNKTGQIISNWAAAVKYQDRE